MRIDQRNAGASVTVNSTAPTYTLDRFYGQAGSGGVFTVQRSTVAPTGFTNSLLATVTTVDASIAAGDIYLLSQSIEGLNCADLAFGTAGASTVTLSFWVRSSVTGTFSGSLSNNSFNRSFAFTYTINAANTFEYKTITIAGDTTGTWATDTTTGLRVYFSLGAGSNYSGTAGSWQAAGLTNVTGATNIIATNGATFYITGVQLEKGSTATSFDYRPYGTELALCQRYYQIYQKPVGRGVMNGTTNLGRIGLPLQVQMRASPTMNISGTIDWFDASGVGTITALNATYTTTNAIEFDALAATGTTALGRPCVLYNGSNTGSLVASAEL
jgi:hypothetical protein